MKRVADGQEPTDVVPLVVVPVQVKIAVAVVPVEVRNTTITVGVDPRRAVIVCTETPISLSFEYSPDCIVFEGISPLPLYTKYLHIQTNGGTLHYGYTTDAFRHYRLLRFQPPIAIPAVWQTYP